MKNSQNQIGILTLTNLNGLLGSDKPGSQNGEPPHFSAAKPQVGMQRRRTMGLNTTSMVYPILLCVYIYQCAIKLLLL